MPKITYIAADATERVVEVESGVSAMEAAVRNLVPGIDGDCGGAAACGTCHVYVDEAWIARTGSAGAGTELEMLALTDGVMVNSRLACQIRITPELDGLILRMPSDQH
jgi:2Fe-2S ferredoxin